MSAAVAARLAAADVIGARYAADAGVYGVLCGGSTGRGQADRWSDLEIGVFWFEPPDEERRRAVVAELGGSGLRTVGDDPVEGCWFGGWWYAGPAGAGLLVEVVHLTIADADALLDGLLAATDIRPDVLTFAAALAYGRPIAGSVDRFVARVREYPRPVAA